MSKSPLPAPDALPTYHPRSGELLAIIETCKGCRNKLKFDEKLRSFALSKVLPAGASFPYDFGFIPGTKAEDGDPLDVLLLMDEPTEVGIAVEIRLVGIIEAEQTEKGEKTVRNDRLIAVAIESHDHSDIHSLKDLSKSLLDEIEHFFISYHQTRGARFKPLGRHGPRRAHALLKRALRSKQDDD